LCRWLWRDSDAHFLKQISRIMSVGILQVCGEEKLEAQSLRLTCRNASSSRWTLIVQPHILSVDRLAAMQTDPGPGAFIIARSSKILSIFDSPWNKFPSLQIPFLHPPTLSHPQFLHQLPNMCPPTEDSQTNGHSNGTNGTNGTSHEGFTSVHTKQNPHPTHKSPYQPVGDFLSNVSRFKIIGTSWRLSPSVIGCACEGQRSLVCRQDEDG
jgi:hypothetical protein